MGEKGGLLILGRVSRHNYRGRGHNALTLFGPYIYNRQSLGVASTLLTTSNQQGAKMATRKTSKKEMQGGSKKISRSGAGPNMVNLDIDLNLNLFDI